MGTQFNMEEMLKRKYTNCLNFEHTVSPDSLEDVVDGHCDSVSSDELFVSSDELPVSSDELKDAPVIAY